MGKTEALNKKIDQIRDKILYQINILVVFLFAVGWVIFDVFQNNLVCSMLLCALLGFILLSIGITIFCLFDNIKKKNNWQMKKEYDFTNAEQGKFYRPIEELEI